MNKSLSGLKWVGMAIIAIFLILERFKAISYAQLFLNALFSPSPIINMLSIIFSVSGLVIAILARRTLGAYWSWSIAIKKNHELITTGIYGYMRHPIYTGVILLVLGLALSIRTIGSFILFFIILFFLFCKLKKEEKLLTKHFPKEYPAYKKRVKALIPYIY